MKIEVILKMSTAAAAQSLALPIWGWWEGCKKSNIYSIPVLINSAARVVPIAKRIIAHQTIEAFKKHKMIITTIVMNA